MSNQESLLTIAAGTPWELVVHDVRHRRTWSKRSGPQRPDPPQRLILHHTVTHHDGVDDVWQYDHLQRVADTAPYGLPYNFVIFPAGFDPRVWYLNDVDYPTPHTWQHNADVALGVVGNYQEQQPSDALVNKIILWLGAMRSLWGMVLPFDGHRDFYPTACPGEHLYWLTREF